MDNGMVNITRKTLPNFETKILEVGEFDLIGSDKILKGCVGVNRTP
jgi:hypothetical protein